MLVILSCSLVCNATVRIAVLDTGYNEQWTPDAQICPNGLYDFTGTGIKDTHGHGSNILGIISKELKNKDYCFYVLKIYPAYSVDPVKYYSAFKKVIELKPDFVNCSLGGSGKDLREKQLVDTMINNGTVFVAAAGNNRDDLDKQCDYFPACYNGVISVGSLDEHLHVSKFSNYGKIIKRWAIGENIKGGRVSLSGTSQATAYVTGDLANALLKQKEQ